MDGSVGTSATKGARSADVVCDAAPSAARLPPKIRTCLYKGAPTGAGSAAAAQSFDFALRF